MVFLCDKFTSSGNKKNTTTAWPRVTCNDCLALKKARFWGKNKSSLSGSESHK